MTPKWGGAKVKIPFCLKKYVPWHVKRIITEEPAYDKMSGGSGRPKKLLKTMGVAIKRSLLTGTWKCRGAFGSASPGKEGSWGGSDLPKNAPKRSSEHHKGGATLGGGEGKKEIDHTT